MKKNTSNLLLVLLLVMISVFLYILQLVFFHSPRDTAFYIFQDLAFIPLQVAIVSLFLNKFISEREKRARLKKMNMAINVFFSGTGTALLQSFEQFIGCGPEIRSVLRIGVQWKRHDFERAIPLVSQHDFKVDARTGDLQSLRSVLNENRGFLLGMLENSNLLEHDAFTDMLWAVFHIMDELTARESLTDLPGSDLDHLSIDIHRAYVRLLTQWVSYLMHLKEDYPYLFSMAVRRNPFDDSQSVVIRHP